MSICEKCIIHGRVQGVFYRSSTKLRAEQLSVTGYAKNLSDGTVEVLICGSAEAVGHMKALLWEGSPASHVSDVKCEIVEVKPPFVFITN